jgi:aminopeptidase YwaD
MLGELLAGKVNNHTIEFAFLNGEDYYSTPGQLQYFNTLNQQAQSIDLAINCDGVGLKDSHTAISYFGLKDSQQVKINSLLKSFNGIEMIEPWQQGDHMLFVLNDIPTIALTSKDIFNMIDKVIHTPKDHQSLVDVKKVIEVIGLIEQFIYALN